jgi:hypothetical protein
MSDTTPLRTYDLSKVQTYAGFLQQLFRLQDAKRMTCLPAIVEKFDRQSNMALVKPLVKFVVNTNNGDAPIDRPSCTVPVFQTCRGGYMIDLPLFRGDTGLLIAMDRDSSTARAANSFRLWEEQNDEDEETIKNTGATPPDGFIYTSFEFGVFIPMAFGSSNLPMGVNPITLEPIPEEGIVIKRMMNPKPNDELPLEKRVTDSRSIEIKVDNDGISASSVGTSLKINRNGTYISSGIANVGIEGSLVSIDAKSQELKDWHERNKKDDDDVLPKTITIDLEKVAVNLIDTTSDASIEIKPTEIAARVKDDKLTFTKDGVSYSGSGAKEFQAISDVKNEDSILYKKTRTMKKFGGLVVDVGEESDWIN